MLPTNNHHQFTTLFSSNTSHRFLLLKERVLNSKTQQQQKEIYRHMVNILLNNFSFINSSEYFFSFFSIFFFQFYCRNFEDPAFEFKSIHSTRVKSILGHDLHGVAVARVRQLVVVRAPSRVIEGFFFEFQFSRYHNFNV